MANKETLETSLFKYCLEGKTGTLSIATNDNKSCQIIINNGEIIAVTLARLKGIDAINKLIEVGFSRATFNQDLQLPFKEEARIESSHKLLVSLGYDSYQTNSDIEEDKPTKSSKRMYRGQIIDD